MGFETPIEMQLILKAASHHAVRREFKELQDVVAKRKVDQESAELWPAQHLAEMAKAGISYTSLASPELNANDWFATFTSREKSTTWPRRLTPTPSTSRSGLTAPRAQARSG